MRQRPLGKTGLSVTKLGLGTWGLSGDGYGPVSDSEQDRVIDRARAMGIRLFETATGYGRGKMEERLGARLEGDAESLVVTKLGTDFDASPPCKRFDAEYLLEEFDRSRERLRREVLDVVLLHNPSERTLERAEATDALKRLKQSGRIRAWGVSAGTEAVARAALVQNAEVVSLAYNVFCCRPLKQLKDALVTAEAGVLAHSTLLYGLLCGEWATDKDFSEGDHRADRWTADELKKRLSQLNALRPTASAERTTLRSVALRFALSNDSISCCILGPRTTQQLDQLVREAGKKPPYLASNAARALDGRLRTSGVEV